MRGLRSVSGDRREWGVYGNVTLLAVIVPVCVVDLEICFAEGGHERDLPKDSLWPGAFDLDVDLTEWSVRGGWNELNGDLVGVEAESGEIIKVVFGEPGTLSLQPNLFWRREGEVGKD